MFLMEQVSEQIQFVMEYFEQYSGYNLRKKNDVAAILHFCMIADKASEFNELARQGKIIWNLYSALRKTASQETERMEQEFATVTRQFRESILGIIQLFPHDSPQIQRFELNYLGTHQGTLRNIVDLSHDLARFKDMQNDEQLKHKESSL